MPIPGMRYWIWFLAIGLSGDRQRIQCRSVQLGGDGPHLGDGTRESRGGSTNGAHEDRSRLLKTDAADEDSQDDQDQRPGPDPHLYNKAKTFGQSDEERRKVQLTLDRLKRVMKTKMNINSTGVALEDPAVARSVLDPPPRPRALGILSKEYVTQVPTDQAAEHAVSSDDNFRRKDYVGKRPIPYLPQQQRSKKPGHFRDSDNPTMPHNPEEVGKYFEGDIVLTADQADDIYEQVVHGEDGRRKRKFVASSSRRWTGVNPIEYSFDGSHSPKEQKIIELALQHWENVTCLNFHRRDDPPKGSRIVLTDVDGCASNVGRNPSGEPQFVSLSTECLRLGVIAHEIAHALGFWHEQSRPDRDAYVSVVWPHISDDSLGQFLKEKNSDVDTEAIRYDYGSIMHYRSKAFAKSDSLFTLLTDVPDYQRTIGQRDQLSFNDIRIMNKVYCSNRCAAPLACQRGGYTDPRTCAHCRCPDGFTGKLCDKVMDGYGTDCGGTVNANSEWTYFNSPNYPRHFEEGQECSWLVTAPSEQRVELEFVDQFDLYCKKEHSLCMDYVEVKNSTDFANTGMRYCCDYTPQGTITSSSKLMLVLFRSFYRSTVGFKARVRAAQPKRVARTAG